MVPSIRIRRIVARSAIPTSSDFQADLLEARGRVATSVLRDLDDFEAALVLSNDLAESQTFRRLHEACRSEAQYAAMARIMVQQRTGLTFEELDEARRSGIL